jgi:hypothetical protein
MSAAVHACFCGPELLEVLADALGVLYAATNRHELASRLAKQIAHLRAADL